MMSELKLNSNKIYELGSYISNFLRENGVYGESDLVVYVDATELRKIDEDLYYRNKPKGEDFVPSDEDLIVKFDNCNIIFSIKEEEIPNKNKKKKQS